MIMKKTIIKYLPGYNKTKIKKYHSTIIIVIDFKINNKVIYDYDK